MDDNFDYKQRIINHEKALKDVENQTRNSEKKIKELAEELARKKEVLSSDAENKLLAFANKGELNLVDNERFNFTFNAPVKIYIKDKCKCNNNQNSCKNKE